MSRKIYFFSVRTAVLYIAALLVIVFLLFHAESSISAVQEAIRLCWQTIIPSLFPFFVLSGVLIQTGFVRVAGRLLSPLMRPLFRVNGSGALAFAIGIISGYPMGAKMVSELYREGEITKTEAQRLLPYCNNSGPLFIIGAVGLGMLHSQGAGVFLYLVHVIAAVLTGLLFRFYHRKEYARPERGAGMRSSLLLAMKTNMRDTRSFGEIFTGCITGAVQTTLAICGFVAFFSVLLACVEPFLNALFSAGPTRLIAKGIFEVTLGVRQVADCGLPMNTILILAAVLIGFGGICVLLQVVGMTAGTDIGIRTYMIGKCVQAGISGCLAALGLWMLPLETQEAFASAEITPASPHVIQWTTLFFLLAVLMVLYSKWRAKRKIKHIKF